MKRKLMLVCYITMLTIPLYACGDTQNPNPDTVRAEENSPENPPAETESSELLPEEEPEEITEPEQVTVSMANAYGDTNIRMELLGLQEYNVLEGEDYTDTPAEGNIYLALFANIQNRTIENDYINPQLLTATVDGSAVENTFLVNAPENYSTIFQNIGVMEELSGYIVWEVPADWQELNFTYSGWEGSAHIILSATLTPEDLNTPPASDDNK